MVNWSMLMLKKENLMKTLTLTTRISELKFDFKSVYMHEF